MFLSRLTIDSSSVTFAAQSSCVVCHLSEIVRNFIRMALFLNLPKPQNPIYHPQP